MRMGHNRRQQEYRVNLLGKGEKEGFSHVFKIDIELFRGVSSLMLNRLSQTKRIS